MAGKFTITKIGSQPRYLSVEWIKKMWYICTTDYYSATEKNEILSFATKWLQLEIIMYKPVAQRQIHIFSNM